ncbi:MAG: TipAS antibiotic-recognition domain-containing protein [Clostridia bacterium]|nr:TipAS antibiotic-recognition domain-containing protein [Clostridia bacterium]
MKSYEKEARRRWGDTEAYGEYEKKIGKYSKEKWSAVTDGLDEIFSRFAECRRSGETAESGAARSLVCELKEYITENFYNCTDEILFGLGQMYVCDGRFKENIDRHGDGTAEFVSSAIAAYSKGRQAE